MGSFFVVFFFVFFVCTAGWIALRVSGGGSILRGAGKRCSDAGKNVVVVVKSLGERGREGRKGKESEKIKKGGG